MYFCPDCGSVLKPDQEGDNLWICDEYDIRCYYEESGESIILSQVPDTRGQKFGYNSKKSLESHPKAPDRCPTCSAPNIDLVVENLSTRKSYQTRCKNCGSQKSFHSERNGWYLVSLAFLLVGGRLALGLFHAGDNHPDGYSALPLS